jgi:hypothetical protein
MNEPRLVYSGVGEGEGEAQKIGSGRVNPWQHFVLVEAFPKFMNKLIVCLPNCFHQIPWFFLSQLSLLSFLLSVYHM